MPIPPLDARGLLPGGCHAGTFAEIESKFLFNLHRQWLYTEVKRFTNSELVANASGLRLILGGSFFSDKEQPADIEATVYLPAAEIGSRLRLMSLSSPAENDRIKSTYRADFYVSLEVQGCSDFGAFFQYVGPKSAHEKGLNEKDARGIVEVQSWELG